MKDEHTSQIIERTNTKIRNDANSGGALEFEVSGSAKVIYIFKFV